MGDILLLGYNGFLFPLFSSTMIMAFMGISATSGTKLNVNVASLASFAATKATKMGSSPGLNLGLAIILCSLTAIFIYMYIMSQFLWLLVLMFCFGVLNIGTLYTDQKIYLSLCQLGVCFSWIPGNSALRTWTLSLPNDLVAQYNDFFLNVFLIAKYRWFSWGMTFTSGRQELGSVFSAAVCKIQASKC